MPTLEVPQESPNNEITAEGINAGPNAIAAVVNGQLDDANIASLSGTKIIAGTVPVTALATAANPETRSTEYGFDFVASGLVWSGDSYGSTRNASMSAGIVYIAGKRLTVSAVTARSFTASKDTYVDIDSTGTVQYTEVANNAASPALAANSIRIAIIITGASNIAAVGSVNQGQESKLLPIVSSTPYAATDSLGNLICPRDPNRKLLGYRQIVTSTPVASGSTPTQVPGLSTTVTIPAGGRRVRITAYAGGYTSTAANSYAQIQIWDGAVNAGTQISQWKFVPTTAGYLGGVSVNAIITAAAGTKTFNVGVSGQVGSTITVDAASTQPAFILVEPF